jgi:SET domain-containing protein
MKYLKTFEKFEFDSIDSDESEYLYVDISQIPNSGKGLFTAIDIEKDEIISQFKGEILSDDEIKSRTESGDDDYFMDLPNGDVLDCKRTECFAKYANDAKGSNTKFKNNSIISLDENDNVVIVAKKNIKSGEEIFVDYGKNYWKNNSYRIKNNK